MCMIICVYICVYMYIYSHYLSLSLYIYIYTHVYVCIYIYIHMLNMMLQNHAIHSAKVWRDGGRNSTSYGKDGGRKVGSMVHARSLPGWLRLGWRDIP